MKNKIFAGMTVMGIALLMSTSCSKLPQTEIDAANQAVELAKEAGADLYVHESFVALRDSLNAVMVGIEEKESKLFKNYSDAKESLAGVVLYAGEVSQQSVARKEELKQEVTATIAEVKALVEAGRQLVLQAPRGKEGASALVAIKAEIDAIEASLTEVEQSFAADDIIGSLNKANAAKEKATSINEELTTVIDKYRGITR